MKYHDGVPIELGDRVQLGADSPVVAINRAIAISETWGPAAGLAALDALTGDRRLYEYQPYWAAHAGLLASIGDTDAADDAYRMAIGLEGRSSRSPLPARAAREAPPRALIIPTPAKTLRGRPW